MVKIKPSRWASGSRGMLYTAIFISFLAVFCLFFPRYLLKDTTHGPTGVGILCVLMYLVGIFFCGTALGLFIAVMFKGAFCG
jgi:hypothetical protein